MRFGSTLRAWNFFSIAKMPVAILLLVSDFMISVRGHRYVIVGLVRIAARTWRQIVL